MKVYSTSEDTGAIVVMVGGGGRRLDLLMSTLRVDREGPCATARLTFWRLNVF
jgi:hypothetical protein